MSILWTRFIPEFAELLTAALIHFIWQGAVLGLMLLVALKMMNVGTARIRYLLSISVLLMMGLAPLLTIALHHLSQSAKRPTEIAVYNQLNPIAERHPAEVWPEGSEPSHKPDQAIYLRPRYYGRRDERNPKLAEPHVS